MKKFLSFILALNLALVIWAMPQFDSYLPDESGEYVYYKDNTFLRESYVGILYYDYTTVQIRYYAPRDEDKKLLEKDIAILVSMDSKQPITGERFLTNVIPGTEDVDIVNYLHDILYEFTSHRKRIDRLNERNIIINQNYDQFGGEVSITYDCTIPLYNIREIKKPTGEVLLHCVTTGKLQDNEDTSFEKFKGFPENEKIKKGKKYKKAKEIKCFFGEQTVILDDTWKQPISNFWTLDDDSVLHMNTVPPRFEDKKQNELFLIRFFMHSAPSLYKDFDTLIIKNEEGRITISCEVYNPLKNNTMINDIILSEKDNSTSYDYFTMTTYKKPYITNKKYFDKIIDSYEN